MTMVVESVLDSVRHARLLADFDHICAIANVKPQFVHSSMKHQCDADEIDWVVNFRMYRSTLAGLVIVEKTDSQDRCYAICGALVRNFIDARVITLNNLLDAVTDKSVPEPTVMVIPNLYVPSLPAWKSSLLYDVLLSRFTANLPTVVAVESMSKLQSLYGKAVHQHLTSHFKLSA